MLLKNVIEGVWTTPWSINASWKSEETQKLMERRTVRFSHILREGNKLDDHLANYALHTDPIVSDNFTQFDIQGRRIVNNDKMQCPYLRVRVSRN